MTFLAFRLIRRRKHRNDVIVTSYIKISQILKLKSKDITSKTLHAKFYASRIKNKRIRRGVKYAPPLVWSVFKSPGKIGLSWIRQSFLFKAYPNQKLRMKNLWESRPSLPFNIRQVNPVQVGVGGGEGLYRFLPCCAKTVCSRLMKLCDF